ncbi:MAG: FimV/HubP family polar landmark protein [Cocleimonas sp.]
MNKKALSLAITLALALPTTVSNALSLGDIESNSSLNQPFRGKINLLSTSAAEAKNLRVRVASPAVFNRVGIDRPAFLNSIRFRTTIQNGRPVILVSSNQPINEPFLNFLLEVSWANGQLLKEYTVLLDPPVLLRADTAIASNGAGVRAEPRAQGRITRPAARAPQMTQQQRVAQQRRQAQAQRQAQVQRQAQQRRLVQQRQAQQRQAQQARRAPLTAQQQFAADARRVLAQQSQRRVARTATNVGRSYRVRRGDTLSRVTKRLGYRGVNSTQMMVALFNKNRSAFVRNNMNNLKAGVTLTRPSLNEVRAFSAQQAKALMVTQAREWKVSRGTAVAAASTNKANNTAKAATQVASNQQARMTVAGTNGSANNAGAGGADIAALNNKLTLTNESLTTKQKENTELKSRVTELESLLRKKNRLITLKSEQLSRLQASAGVAPGSPITTAQQQVEAVVTPAVTQEAMGSDIQAQMANNLSQENGEIIRGSMDSEGVIETIEGFTQEEVAQPSAFVDATVTEETDVLSLLQSPAVLGSGALLGLLGLGGMWFMRRRKDNEYEEFGGLEIDNQMDDSDEMEFDDVDADIDTSEIEESQFVSYEEVNEAKESEVDEGEEDILQEADVYIVYGLHDQAESELKQAIEKNPDNIAYRAKLLENYKAAGDVESFEEEAKAFMELEAEGKDQYMDDITEWGSSLNPDSNLFSGALAAGAGVAMVAGTALADDANEEMTDVAADALSGTIEIDDGLEDFNLDDILSADDLTPDIEEGVEVLEGTDVTGLIDSDDMSIDLDMDFDEVLEGDNFEEVAMKEVQEELDSADDLLDGLDTDLAFNSALDTDLDTGLDVANLNLDIDSDGFEKIMPEDNAYKSVAKDELDVVEKSVNSEVDTEDNLLADFDDNLSFLDLDDNAEAIEETQIDTKLDLAKAYIDMGDIEGARSTLEEVMLDGSDDQRREAEELLQSTG